MRSKETLKTKSNITLEIRNMEHVLNFQSLSSTIFNMLHVCYLTVSILRAGLMTDSSSCPVPCTLVGTKK